ncbi:hypothetical protein VN97_g3283 [Penicillium thymicola]|uniref:Uncharacterized protein n=1 Tax=Penicillium thymicola TaxID=293382 RepID=A0AAI9XAP3_PENTH|nr:hypothetical protein VN97_g3283 [Penicillium thymicola]
MTSPHVFCVQLHFSASVDILTIPTQLCCTYDVHVYVHVKLRLSVQKLVQPPMIDKWQGIYISGIGFDGCIKSNTINLWGLCKLPFCRLGVAVHVL